jgi:hypothetical protein
MISIDCPICAGEASTDDDLTVMTCDGCGVAVEVAPDATTVLGVAA